MSVLLPTTNLAGFTSYNASSTGATIMSAAVVSVLIPNTITTTTTNTSILSAAVVSVLIPNTTITTTTNTSILRQATGS